MGGIGFGCRDRRGGGLFVLERGEKRCLEFQWRLDPIVVQHTDEGFGCPPHAERCGEEIMQAVDCADGLVPAFTRWTVPSGDHEMGGGISSIITSTLYRGGTFT